MPRNHFFEAAKISQWTRKKKSAPELWSKEKYFQKTANPNNYLKIPRNVPWASTDGVIGVATPGITTSFHTIDDLACFFVSLVTPNYSYKWR
ncbi:hypothetical protein BOTNAR_0049g00110 [Botryotinia narcissicola]|uniref:Uncharacterized protein n=1 Tax=Botryotinia narcissicola TaxID=278944 RepID=A0A4Z1J1K9_9HELO|nr:hypothetical protein BOTNAR_0049g00110 [Botryotinia narcissicola]